MAAATFAAMDEVTVRPRQYDRLLRDFETAAMG